MILELNLNCSWRGNYIDVIIDDQRLIRIGIYGNPEQPMFYVPKDEREQGKYHIHLTGAIVDTLRRNAHLFKDLENDAIDILKD